MPLSEYKEACKNKTAFMDMRSFADEEKLYLRQVDKEKDKDFLESWTNLRDNEDIMREALFGLLCYKRFDQNSKPVHMQYYDRNKKFSLVRGLSIFFSSKPKISFPSRPSHTDAYKAYEIPKTDLVLRANFLKYHNNKIPSFEPPKEIANPKHDSAMWGRFGLAYYGENNIQTTRKRLFAMVKWAFGDKNMDYADFFSEEKARRTAEYVKLKTK
jgi:hypothetical protein